MANLCYNSIHVRGAKEDILRFHGIFSGYHPTLTDRGLIVESGFSFANFVPLNYDELVSTSRRKTWTDPDSARRFKQNWLADERMEHWGIRRDIKLAEFSIGGFDVAIDAEPESIVEVRYSMYLPWDHCQPVVNIMAAMFPTVEFDFEYDEPGCEIAGKVKYLNGQICSEKHCEAEYRRFKLFVFNDDYYMCKGDDCGSLWEWDEIQEEKGECLDCGTVDEYYSPEEARKILSMD